MAAQVGEQASFFSDVTTITIASRKAKPTGNCLLGRRWKVRRPGFIDRLPVSQPGTPACPIAVLHPPLSWTFQKAASVILGIPASTPSTEMGLWLIERRHTLGLPQIEELVERVERGEEVGMNTGWGSFFFTPTRDEEDPVAVVYVQNSMRRWMGILHEFSSGNRWNSGPGLLVGNFDVTQLGP